jgi:hypothetical protein
MKKKNIANMTRKDFEKVPYRTSFNQDVGDFDSLIILSTRKKHDSGYRCIDFIACVEDKPICRLSGCSDVLHINGIGGYGYKWIEKGIGIPSKVDVVPWSIDCLPKSGLFRI